MHTGNTRVLAHAAAPECRGCNGLVESIGDVYAEGRRLAGGGWSIEELARDTRVLMPYERFAVSIRQPKSALVGEGGKVLSRGHQERFVLAFSVLWRDGRWLAYESVQTK